MSSSTTLFSPIETLPVEVLALIQEFLLPQHIISGATDTTNKQFYSASHPAWKHRYTKEFGPLPFNENPKIQYAAETIYRRAISCKRTDIALTHYRKLRNLLSHYKDKAWAQYYFAVMQFYGHGVKLNQKDGFALLIRCHGAGDSRATLKMADILTTCKTDMNLIAPDNLLDTLVAAHNNKKIKASLQIARLYSDQNNNEHAKKWYQVAIEDDETAAVSELLELESGSINFREELIKKKILWLEDLFKQHESPTIQSEINFQIITQYYLLKQLDEALEKADADPAFKTDGNRLYLLGSIYKALGEAQQAVRFASLATISMRDAAFAGQQDAIKQKFMGNVADVALNLEKLKRLYCTEKTSHQSIIIAISEHIRSTTHASALFDSSSKVWWLQLAAQNGCDDSLKLLLNHTAHTGKAVPYVYCALGLIYTYGVIGSTRLEADATVAEKWFKLAKQHNPASINSYYMCGTLNKVIEATHSASKLFSDLLHQKNNAKKPRKK